MSAKYPRQTLQDGLTRRLKLKNEDQSFAFSDSTPKGLNTGRQLDQKNRMAGQRLKARSDAMMNDPQEQKDTAEWWSAFKKAPQSGDWVIARKRNSAEGAEKNRMEQNVRNWGEQ